MDGPLGPNLKRIRAAGYEGFEAPMLSFGPGKIRSCAKGHGLRYTGQSVPLSEDDLKEGLDTTVVAGGIMLNLHTGTDWWPFERGVALFDTANLLHETSPIPKVLDRHRRRLVLST